jgi:hypothetical protein
MANISVSLPSDGETIDVSDYNTPINTIVNEINGGLDNSNITAAAAIAGSKLADGGISTDKYAADSITDSKLANGKIRARVGGNGTVWGTAGTTNYDTDALDVVIQTGTVTTSSSGTVSVTFPVAFVSNPLIIGSQQGSVTTRAFCSVDSSSNTGFTLSAISTANARAATVITWIAIGI